MKDYFELNRHINGITSLYGINSGETFILGHVMLSLAGIDIKPLHLKIFKPQESRIKPETFLIDYSFQTEQQAKVMAESLNRLFGEGFCTYDPGSNQKYPVSYNLPEVPSIQTYAIRFSLSKVNEKIAMICSKLREILQDKYFLKKYQRHSRPSFLSRLLEPINSAVLSRIEKPAVEETNTTNYFTDITVPIERAGFKGDLIENVFVRMFLEDFKKGEALSSAKYGFIFNYNDEGGYLGNIPFFMYLNLPIDMEQADRLVNSINQKFPHSGYAPASHHRLADDEHKIVIDPALFDDDEFIARFFEIFNQLLVKEPGVAESLKPSVYQIRSPEIIKTEIGQCTRKLTDSADAILTLNIADPATLKDLQTAVILYCELLRNNADKLLDVSASNSELGPLEAASQKIKERVSDFKSSLKDNKSTLFKNTQLNKKLNELQKLAGLDAISCQARKLLP